MRGSRMVMLSMSTLLLCSCSNESQMTTDVGQSAAASKVLDLKVRALRNTETEYVWSDGTTARGQDEYLQTIQLLLAEGFTIGNIQIDAEEEGGQINIGEPPAAPSSSISMEQPLAIQVYGTVYTVVITAHSHMLYACINRNVPHLGFLISRQGQRTPIVDEHAAVWSNGGRPCFGLYQSAPIYWCWAKCGPTYKEVTGTLTAVLVAAGVTSSVASVIANVVAPIAVAGVAF